MRKHPRPARRKAGRSGRDARELTLNPGVKVFRRGVIVSLLVLVVEDDALIQLEVEAALHDGGYSTDTESSGEAAIGRLEANPNICALVTDINLIGEKTGWDVARRAREIFSDMPVIYVTSALTDDWTAQGVPKSILIRKPFAPAQITTLISQLFSAGESLITRPELG